MSRKVVIGALPYLNAWPLLYGLAEHSGVELRLAVPSALEPLLRSGEVDVALLPVIEYFRICADSGERARSRVSPVLVPKASVLTFFGTGPCGTRIRRTPYGEGARSNKDGRSAPTLVLILPLGAVASRGAIGSVRLFGYADVKALRRVLLDPASRTANGLARVLLARRFGVHPHFVMPDEVGPNPPRPPDAELVIGNRGLVAERPQAKWVCDLGLEWHRFVHRPFVYAFWVARADAPLGRLAEVLMAARDAGLAAREALAVRAERELGIPADVARRHLLTEVRYGFGQKEQEGIRVFYQMAVEEGLVPEGGRLRFAPPAAVP